MGGGGGGRVDYVPLKIVNWDTLPPLAGNPRLDTVYDESPGVMNHIIQPNKSFFKHLQETK